MQILEYCPNILDASSEQGDRSNNEEIPVGSAQRLSLGSPHPKVVHVSECVVGQDKHDYGTY